MTISGNDIFWKVCQQYRELETYSDSGRVSWNTTELPGFKTFSTHFKRPDCMSFESAWISKHENIPSKSGVKIWTDGRSFTSHLSDETNALKSFEEFMAAAAGLGICGATMALLELGLSETPPDWFVSKSWQLKDDQIINNENCYYLANKQFLMQLCVEKKTFMVRRWIYERVSGSLNNEQVSKFNATLIKAGMTDTERHEAIRVFLTQGPDRGITQFDFDEVSANPVIDQRIFEKE